MSIPEFVTVWICEDCGNFYAASSAGDLRTKINTDKETHQPSFSRARCPTPTCAAKGTMRTPYNLSTRKPMLAGAGPQSDAPMPLPESAPELPQWSGSICDGCGGQMVRTGNCETCSSCGSTSGCG